MSEASSVDQYRTIAQYLAEKRKLMTADDPLHPLRAQLDQEMAAARDAGLSEVQAALIVMFALLSVGGPKIAAACLVYNLTPVTVVTAVLMGAFDAPR